MYRILLIIVLEIKFGDFVNIDNDAIDVLNCLCPIFVRHADDSIEQIASGVYIEIGCEKFLLTAAHVMEWKSKGVLLAPTSLGIEKILGFVAFTKQKNTFSKVRDIYDIAYIRLTPEFSSRLSSEFKPLSRNEIWMTDNICTDDAYSFSGYPIKKAKTVESEHSSEMFSYTGEAAQAKKYKTLGYDGSANILINFRRKKSVDLKKGKQIPPHPKGISGGAVFRWPKAPENAIDFNCRRLVGIGHTYIEQHNCLVGTKISLYMKFIAQHYPQLFPKPESLKDNEIPMFMCLVGYLRDEWDELMLNFNDAENMQDSWLQWRDSVETGIEHYSKSGVIPLVVNLTNQEIVDYCQKTGSKNIGQTRNIIASKKFMEIIQEEEL